MAELAVEGASAGEPLVADLAAAVDTVPGRTVIDEFEALWESICTQQKPAPDGFEEDAASTASSVEALRDLEPRSGDEDNVSDLEERVADALKSSRQKRKKAAVGARSKQRSGAQRISSDSPLFGRAGHFVTWNGSRIGKCTAWGANLSCHCLLHGAGCKTPAVSAGKIPSDKVFVDWLLGAMSHDNIAPTSRADHSAQGKALKDQHR